MRPIEVVLVVGAVGLVLTWMAGARARRWVPALLAVVAAVHLFVEGWRLAMLPAYVVIGLGLIGALVRSGPPAPKRRGWWTAGRAVLGTVVLVLVAAVPVLWPVIRLPKPSGPYAVGQTWLVVVDSSRKERFSTEPGAIRRFPVKIWYPATPGSTGMPADYADPREFAAPGLPAPLFGHLRLMKTNALIGAPLATDQRFPLLVFSHGYGGTFGQNTVQMEELASRGYVVASIAHPGESAWAPFPDGGGMPMDTATTNRMVRRATPEAMKEMLADMAKFDSIATPEEGVPMLRSFLAKTDEPLRSESVAEWAADTRVLLDLFATFDHGGADTPFHGRVDLDRIGVFGMSYGGATAGEFCRLDDRCKAGLNIDGGQYGGLMDDSLRVPFMIMSSSQAYGLHLPVLAVTRAPAFLVKVPETTHVGLTDLPLLAPRVFRWIGLSGSLDADRRSRIMTAYVVAFFDSFLKKEPSPLLEGPSAEFPEVSIVKRNLP
ncbi:MAG: hypothetical protein JNJ80_13720 [Gemmatimonadetes bacterium]|nr:hypothetical protein [Gemmatimonadota bacterium]